MEKRHVPLLVLITLMKGKKTFGLIGLAFIIISFISLIVLFTVAPTLHEPYEDYNHEAIAQNGTEKDAVITALTPLTNVTINNEHPLVISYDYKDGNKKASDKFETLELQKVQNYKVGDTVKVKAYNNQSAIVGVDSFAFPITFVFIGPGIFLVIGSIFFLIGLFPALKIYNLYKSGVVREATVFSMFIDNGTGRNTYKGVIVNYHYQSSLSRKLSGTVSTPDLTIMQETRPDDTIKIFVSETDETQSTLVPKKLVRKYGWRV